MVILGAIVICPQLSWIFFCFFAKFIPLKFEGGVNMLEREQVPKDYCTYCLGVPVMFTIEVMNGIVLSTITS